MEKYCFIFGYGYTASYLAARLAEQGFKIVGTSRDPNQSAYKTNGHSQLINFYHKDEINSSLRQASHLLISIPPNKGTDPVIACYGDELLKLKHRRLAWVGYLSTTGVYGDHQGAWVDEDSPSKALSSHGSARLKAEHEWIDLAQDHFDIHLFRLAGIYGPYRNALSNIINGKSSVIYKEGHYFSRIHVGDIVKIIMASVNKPNPGSIYNVADDLPAPSHEVEQFAVQLLNRNPLPLVPFNQALLSPMAREFYKANRKVSNKKVKQELGIELDYHNYQQGLTQLLQNGEY